MAEAKMLNDLAKYSAPAHDPTMFAGCRFDEKDGVVKLVAGNPEEASRLLEISGALSREEAMDFRMKRQFAVEDLNVANLKASLSAELLQKLTGRIWFPDYTPGEQAVDANQWSVDETYSIRPLLRRAGIIKNDANLRINDVPDGDPETRQRFDWKRASITISDINLDALLTTVEKMGIARHFSPATTT